MASVKGNPPPARPDWTTVIRLHNNEVGEKSDITLTFKDEANNQYEVLLLKRLSRMAQGEADIRIEGIHNLQAKITEVSLVRWYDHEGKVRFSFTRLSPTTSDPNYYFIMLRIWWGEDEFVHIGGDQAPM